MIWNRKAERRAALVRQGVFGVFAVLGLLVILREVPAMRRYLRMERM